MSPTCPPEIYEQALRCYSSWAQFGIPLCEGEALVLQAFHALDNETVFDTAIDALVSVFSHHDNCKWVTALFSTPLRREKVILDQNQQG